MTSDRDPFAGLPPASAAGIATSGSGLDALPAQSSPNLPDDPPDIRPSILIIDDELDFVQATAAYVTHTSLARFATVETFRLTAENFPELVAQLAAKAAGARHFDAVYIDMNLAGHEGGGLALARRLRADLPALRYTPFAIITAAPGERARRAVADSRILRYIIKTDPLATPAGAVGSFLVRLVLETPELISQADDQIWFDLTEQVAERRARAIESVEATITYVVGFLQAHFGINAIYARELVGNGTLTAIAQADGFDVETDHLPVVDVPFIANFINDPNMPAFHVIDELGVHQLPERLKTSVGRHRALLARMSFGRRTTGVITVYRPPTSRRFRRADGHFLYQLAQQLGAALQAERDLKLLRARQTELAKFVKELAGLDDEAAILKSLCALLHREIGESAPGNPITTVRAVERGTINVPRATPPLGRMLGPPTITLEMVGVSTMAEVIENGVRQVDEDVREARGKRFVYAAEDLKSHITVPVASGEACIGAANIESSRSGAFSEDDAVYAEALSAVAADALMAARARAFNRGMIDLLSEISVEADVEPADVIGTAMRLLFDFTGYSELLYFVPCSTDPDKPWQLVSAYGRGGGLMADEVHRKWKAHLLRNWGGTYLKRCITQGHSVNYTHDPDEMDADEGVRGRGAGKTRSEAVLLARDRSSEVPVAALVLLFVQTRSLNAMQRELLGKFGAVLADWLQRQREIRRIVGLVSVREQEARLGQVLGQFRHNLMGQLGLLRQALENQRKDRITVEEMRDKIQTILDHLLNEFDRRKNLVKVPALVEVHLANTWNKVKRSLAAVRDAHGAEFRDSRFATAVWPTDPDIFESLLFNLADNALRHAGNSVHVWVESWVEEGRLIVDVIDTGRGLAPGIRDRLFEPGVTSSNSGTGLGLYLTRLRAKDVGGDVDLAETGPAGTRFRITLPHPEQGTTQ
jgi:signal transduction histidine kinase/CheY-like chemotaxis protein